MKPRLIIPTALLAVATLAGCGGTDDPAPAEEDGAASPEVAACTEFFEGTGTPLAQRADDDRDALTAGEITDADAYGEINMLDQRLAELAADSPDNIAALLDEIATPFSEAVELVNEAHYAGEDEEGLPDLSGVDVETSQSAQDDLVTTCSDAGFEVAED